MVTAAKIKQASKEWQKEDQKECHEPENFDGRAGCNKRSYGLKTRDVTQDARNKAEAS